MKKLLFILAIIVMATTSQAQVAQSFGFRDYSFSSQVNIGGGSRTTAPSAVLELGAASGSTKGLLLPRGDRTQVVAPAVGLIFYDINDKKIYQWDGASWVLVGPGILGNNFIGVGNSLGNVTGSAGLTWDGLKLHVAGTADFTGSIKLASLAADPTGSNGSLYYSTATNQFRIFQNGAWTNMAPDYSGAFLQNQSTTSQLASFKISGSGELGSTMSVGSWLKVGSMGSDPAGTAGTIYYNSSSNKFRAYQNGAWADMIGASGNFIQAQTTSMQSAGFKITGPATIGDGTTAGQGQWTAAPANSTTNYFLTYGGNQVNQGFLKMDAATLGANGWPGLITLSGTTPTVLSSGTITPRPVFNIDLQTASPDVAMTGYSAKIYRTANTTGSINTIGFNADIDGGGQTGANATAFYANAVISNATPTGKAYAFYANQGMIRLANMATQPAGTDGAMFFNTAAGKTQIYQNGQWNSVGFEGSFAQLFTTPSTAAQQSGGLKVAASILGGIAVGSIGGWLRFEPNGASEIDVLNTSNGWGSMKMATINLQTTKAPTGLTYQLVINDQGAVTSQAISSGSATESITEMNAATYTATSSDKNIIFEYGTGAGTLTMPAASSNSGKVLWVTNTSSNTLSISPAFKQSNLTSGSSIISGQTLKLISDGTSWWAILF